MTLHEFIRQWTGWGVDHDGVYGYQCVDLFRFYVQDVLHYPQPWGVPKGAADLWTNYDYDPNLNQHFIRIPYVPGGIPKRGYVVIWGRKYGRFGHVAIVACADGIFLVCMSQNDPPGARAGLREYEYEHLLGWFVPIDQIGELEDSYVP